MTRSHRQIAQLLLDAYGTTYAHQAGITLADKPSPLYRLLVLAALLSTRIDAEIAVTAAWELSGAGFRTPRRMLDATWQQRVDALVRGHYRRYDESTATRLGEGAQGLWPEMAPFFEYPGARRGRAPRAARGRRGAGRTGRAGRS